MPGIKDCSGDGLSNKQTVVYYGKMGAKWHRREKNREWKTHLSTAVTATLKIAL